MKKRVKIGFTESSKAITAATTIEWLLESDESFINNEALEEAKELFDAAQKWAAQETMRRKI